VTREAAASFQAIVDNMRAWEAEPDRIAHFLTKLVFCLFAEDAGLLPRGMSGERGIFAEIVSETRQKPDDFVLYVQQLFQAMADGGKVLLRDIPYFNGSLFEDVDVARLGHEALSKLYAACQLDWSAVEPSIFGTLFERTLDPKKRAQLGAHYISRDDILLIVEPVLMQPLRRAWAKLREQAQPLNAAHAAATTPRARNDAVKALTTVQQQMLERLRSIRVLDPACGSGNFLYVSLQLLMDMEKEVLTDALFAVEGMTTPFPEVHPRQLYGIERDPIAHGLASIVVWIGYLQWREQNGYSPRHREPILEAMSDHVVCMDAIMQTETLTLNPSPERGVPLGEGLPEESSGRASRLQQGLAEESSGLASGLDGGLSEQDSSGLPSPSGTPRSGEGLGVRAVTEPDWPAVDVIVGNPPFLGGSVMRSELGDDYVTALRRLYDGRVPGGADLVAYWYEKARAQIAAGKAQRAGLLATNSIRGGASREVLKRIKDSGDIFMAWADREWLLAGAAVRVSMVGFDDGSEKTKVLDGAPVANIAPDLTSVVDVTIARVLAENARICFRSDEKGGPFDIEESIAKEMLAATNSNGKSNSDVVRHYVNGLDVVRRPRNMWVIDFGVDTTEEFAKQYEKPFEYIESHVKPVRARVNNERERRLWWLHRRPAPDMRTAIATLKRFIATPALASYRLFVWFDSMTIPDHQVHVIARDDDYFFGVLHSRFHELWSLRMGTSLEDRPRYTPTTTFETFPFPWSPGTEDTASPHYAAISAAAKALHEERAAWLSGNALTPNPSPERRVRLGEGLPEESSGGNSRLDEGLPEESSASPSLYTERGAGGEVSELPSPSGTPRSGRPSASAEGGQEVRADLRDRTLTNLYNALNVWRGTDKMKTVPAAADFAPRLDDLHRALDAAVCAAYGWDAAVLQDEEEMLRRLLALNLARAEQNQ